jgi:hypothetical protein
MTSHANALLDLLQLYLIEPIQEIADRCKQKKHLGLGLFCSKKPPKLSDENFLTHHQHAFKKAILMERCGEDDEEKMKHNLFISRDDKAYICPGTGTGMQSARNVKIIQPSDPSKQRVLPKYDFPDW